MPYLIRLTAVGILAEKLLNKSGLEDAVTWAFVL